MACPGAKGERCVGGCVCGGGWRWPVLELKVRDVWVGVCVGGLEVACPGAKGERCVCVCVWVGVCGSVGLSWN